MCLLFKLTVLQESKHGSLNTEPVSTWRRGIELRYFKKEILISSEQKLERENCNYTYNLKCFKQGF